MMNKFSFLSESRKLYSVMCLLLAGLFCLSTSQAFGANVVIDDFTVSQGSSAFPPLQRTSVGSSGPVSVTGSTANIVGGHRHLFLTQTTNVASIVSKAWVDVNEWDVSNDPGASGWGRVVWNGSATEANYGLALDWTNLSYINMAYLSNDNSTTFYLRVFTSAGNYGTASVVVPSSLTNHQFVQGDFSVTGSLNWANITRIEMWFDPRYAIDTRVLRLDAQLEAPNIDCVTKRWSLNSDWSGLVQTVNLPPGTTFPLTLYAEFTVANTGDGNDTVYIEDTLPAGLTLASVVPDAIISPPGFTLGNASGVGPGVVSWTSTSELKAGESLVFRYRITVAAFEGSKSNTFRARAGSDSVFSDTPCPAYVLYSPQRVPSLNQWGVILLSLLLIASAIWLMRKRRTS